MSLKDPLVQRNNSESKNLLLSYEEKPATVVDYLIISGFMISTYVLIGSVLYVSVKWSTDSKNTLANNYKYYRENNYFNLSIFIVFIIVFGIIWLFNSQKRKVFRKQLIDEKITQIITQNQNQKFKMIQMCDFSQIKKQSQKYNTI